MKLMNRTAIHFALSTLRYDLAISVLAVAKILFVSFLATMICVSPN